MIEAIASAAELSFVRCETHSADASRAAGLCRRLRLAGAPPPDAGVAAADNYLRIGALGNGQT